MLRPFYLAWQKFVFASNETDKLRNSVTITLRSSESTLAVTLE